MGVTGSPKNLNISFQLGPMRFFIQEKKSKLFFTGCPKSALIWIFPRDNRNKKLGNVKNFQVWVA